MTTDLNGSPDAAASQPLAQVQALIDAGDGPGAVAFCTNGLAAQPDNADLHRYLGQLHVALGDRPAAMRHAKRACELAPEDARSWSDLGRVYASRSQLDDASRCFAEAVQTDPRHADAWHNLGTAKKKRGDREGAFKALRTALLLDPKRAETYLNLGNLLIESDQFEDALECFERAAQHDPTMARARSRLAQEFSQRGKVQRAESLFRQSLGLDPHHVQGWFGLGRTLEDLGEAEGALGCYLNVLSRHPGHAQAMGQYLALVRDEADTRVLELGERTMTDPQVDDEARALVGYGLAKYHDRRRDFEQAARAGLAANAGRRAATGPLDRKALTARVDGIISTFTSDFFTEHRRLGLGTDQPVFIVGLPRSGTTLTEQILSAHPLMHGSGELPDLSRLAARCVSGDEQPWQAAGRLDEMTSRQRAHEYLKALRDGAQKGRLRISDKSPLNFFQLAFAAVLFPNARVIHCQRDARDNALSIWMENFNADQRYSTDFDDLAFFALQYRRLMAHWREHLPLKMLELQYEQTVANLEGQARRLIGFLGVPWDARCLDFHKSERAVQTPSRWQVRQPIYTNSVARWRAYAEWVPALDTAFSGFDA